jgi:HlyD family secretion protein
VISRKSLYLIVVIVVIVMALVVFLSRPDPVLVKVAVAEIGKIEETAANTRAGTVKACRRAQMSPAMGGMIDRLPVREGDRVKQGDLLLSLWSDDLQAELKLSRSDARAAAARAESACVQADNAESTARRMTTLSADKLVSIEAVEQAQSNATALRAECAAAQAGVKVSHERIDVVTANLERSLLRAPFDGVVVQVNGEVGEYVTPSPPGILTLPAVDMIDSSCFYVNAPIDEVDAPRIKVGMPARVTLDAFKDRRFAAKVSRTADYVLDLEKQSRTVDVEVRFDNVADYTDLLPGYSADAEVIIATRENVLRVPSESVVDKKYVYVLAADNKLQKREVTIGLANWDFTEIDSGVKAGEQVVVTPDRKGVAEGVMAEIEAKA